jgi:hypothetical protein
MSKPHKIKLSVPKPCSQDWDKMTPDEKGRHCNLCSKSVVDFSKYTDKELLEFFSTVKEKVCGRINNYQLNRIIAVHESSDTSIFKRLLFGTALAAGVTSAANGQSNVNTPVNTNQTLGDTSKKSGINNAPELMPTHYLSGKILDSVTKASLPFCQVVLSISDGLQVAGTISDDKGYFQFPITDDLLNKFLTLTTEMEGFKDIKRSFSLYSFSDKNCNQQFEMVSEEDSAVSVGCIIYEPPAFKPNINVHTFKKGDTPYW